MTRKLITIISLSLISTFYSNLHATMQLDKFDNFNNLSQDLKKCIISYSISKSILDNQFEILQNINLTCKEFNDFGKLYSLNEKIKLVDILKEGIKLFYSSVDNSENKVNILEKNDFKDKSIKILKSITVQEINSVEDINTLKKMCVHSFDLKNTKNMYKLLALYRKINEFNFPNIDLLRTFEKKLSYYKSFNCIENFSRELETSIEDLKILYLNSDLSELIISNFKKFKNNKTVVQTISFLDTCGYMKEAKELAKQYLLVPHAESLDAALLNKLGL